MALPPQLSPDKQTPPPQSGHFGWVLLAHLGLVLLLHVGRQLIDDDAGLFGIFFLIAFADLFTFFLLLVLGNRRLALSFLLSGLLLGVIGFSDCATHLHLGSMH